MRVNKLELFYKIFYGFIAVGFMVNMIFSDLSAAKGGIDLSTSGTMVVPSLPYTPAIIAGITVYPENPFQFDFIIDTGDHNLRGEALRKESQKLINYFFTTLTVPDEEMWVNLSPYESNRIIADGLGSTEMGRDMLLQDYMLKQLAASFMSPEDELGDRFWKKVHQKMQAMFETKEIITNAFHKVWIVPEKAAVYINETSAFVSESHLNVILEEDYLALMNNGKKKKYDLQGKGHTPRDRISAEIKKRMKEFIIPEIEKEVNSGKNFSNLRQIYHSMILATWYKKIFKKNILSQLYINRNKITGIDLKDKEFKNKIYRQYVQAFKKGVFDYIKEDYDPAMQKIISRKYFSGGFENVDDVSQHREIKLAKLVGERRARRSQKGIYLQKVKVKGNLIDYHNKIIGGGSASDVAMPSLKYRGQEENYFPVYPRKIVMEKKKKPGKMEIVFDVHTETIKYVDELAEKMKNVDTVFVEINNRLLWLDIEHLLNKIAQGHLSPREALDENFLLRLIVQTEKPPMFGSHVWAIMEALYKAYQISGKGREVITERYESRRLRRRAFRVGRKLHDVVKFLHSGNLEKTVVLIRKSYDELAITSLQRDKEYIQSIKDTFYKKKGQKALLIRGAAHTELFLEFKKNIPEIEVKRNFLGESNFIFSLAQATIRNLIFQKAGILATEEISSLEYLQGILGAELYSIAMKVFKTKKHNARMLNTISRRLSSMEIMRRLFDDVKKEEILKLKKKDRERAYHHFLIHWLLSEGIATPQDLAQAFGKSQRVEEFIAQLGNRDESVRANAIDMIDVVAQINDSFLIMTGEEFLKKEEEVYVATAEEMPIISEEGEVGGIDFNPETFHLKEQGQKLEFTSGNALFENREENFCMGILPIITSIEPITSFAPFMSRPSVKTP